MVVNDLLSAPAEAQPGGGAGGATGGALGLPADLSGDAEAQGFADLLFANGMAELAAKRYEKALPLFQKAASTWPLDATFNYLAAICRLRIVARESGAGGVMASTSLADAIDTLRRSLPPAANRVPESRVRYDLGEAYYILSDFVQAERELRASIRLDDGDAWAHFLLGLTLFSQNPWDQGDEALVEFNAAARLDPSLAASAAYYDGIEASKRGDTEAARTSFRRALEGAAGREIRMSSESWLKGLQGGPDSGAEPGAPPRFEVRESFSAEYDSNPKQITDEVPVPGTKIESDWRGVLQLRAGWQPIAARRGWTVGLVFNGYASRHDTFDETDLEGAQGVVQGAWGADPAGYVSGPLGFARTATGAGRIGFLIQGGSSFFRIGGESFRRDNEVAGSMIVHEPGLGKTQLDVHYDSQKYFTNDDLPQIELLSGHTTTIRLGQYFYLSKTPGRYLLIAISRAMNPADAWELAKDTRQGSMELALPITERWRFFLNGALSKDDYRDDTLFESADRADLGASLLFAFARSFYAAARYTWTRRDVDPESGSFRRKVAALGLTWHW